MTSFLFIPTTLDTRQGRRVDFAGIASLFAEPEEVLLARRPADTKARLIACLLIMLCVIGDTVLIARPEALTAGVSISDVIGRAPTLPVRS